MRIVHTRHWDAADCLKTDSDIDAYLDAAFEDRHPRLITAVLGDIARTRGKTQVAADMGCSRESLHKAPPADGRSWTKVRTRGWIHGNG